MINYDPVIVCVRSKGSAVKQLNCVCGGGGGGGVVCVCVCVCVCVIDFLKLIPQIFGLRHQMNDFHRSSIVHLFSETLRENAKAGKVGHNCNPITCHWPAL